MEKWKEQIPSLFMFVAVELSEDEVQESLGWAMYEFLHKNNYSEKTGIMLLNSIDARDSFYKYLEKTGIKIKLEREGKEPNP